ncbi:hypothetical protein PC123_g5862 [Phytophthora cactorum]|nr:hypothetical protein PC123_g5862 [Phytophthora cactorum]
MSCGDGGAVESSSGEVKEGKQQRVDPIRSKAAGAGRDKYTAKTNGMQGCAIYPRLALIAAFCEVACSGHCLLWVHQWFCVSCQCQLSWSMAALNHVWKKPE